MAHPLTTATFLLAILAATAGAQVTTDRVVGARGGSAPGLALFAGRRVAAPIRGSWPAGPHEITWDARGLAPGVYLARLTADGATGMMKMMLLK